MKRIFSLVLILLMVIPYVSAVPILDASTRFLTEGKDYMDSTQEISLSLMALGSSYSIAENLTKENITLFVEELLERQNSDGGWGYYEGSISNVVDTSYAVIALKRVIDLYYPNEDIYRKISKALENGLDFISGSYTLNGWGYIPSTLPEFYPTVMALWALGENGYSIEDEMIKDAIKYLENVTKPGLREEEVVALKILAYNSVGYSIEDSLIEKAWGLVKAENSTIKEKALLTYALLNYEGVTFETAKMVGTIENLNERYENGFLYWANEPEALVEREALQTSALATLDIGFAELGISPVLLGFSREVCLMIKSSQNPDGGWSYLPKYPSNEIATYYVLANINLCFSGGGIDEALNWAKSRLPVNQEAVLKERRLLPRYVYNLLILAKFNMLSEEEKHENIELIKSLKLQDELWGNILGPQPKETALAIKALLALGVSQEDPDIQKAKKWLLSISEGGWGTYVQSRYYSYMTTPEVETTLEVLEALSRISTKEELQPHINWLINQKTDIGWPNVKTIYFYNVLVYTGEPRTDLTARAVNLLSKFGYNYREDFVEWILDHREEIKDKQNLLEAALVLRALYPSPDKIDLWWINKVLYNEGFQVVYTPGKYYTARFVQTALENHFNKTYSLSEFEDFEESNYVVVGDLDDFNISKYNPAVSIEVKDDVVLVNGRPYKLQDYTTIIIAGKYEHNYIMFVLYHKNSKAVREIFSSGMFKYFRSPVVISWYKYSDVPWIMPELVGEFVG